MNLIILRGEPNLYYLVPNALARQGGVWERAQGCIARVRQRYGADWDDLPVEKIRVALNIDFEGCGFRLIDGVIEEGPFWAGGD